MIILSALSLEVGARNRTVVRQCLKESTSGADAQLLNARLIMGQYERLNKECDNPEGKKLPRQPAQGTLMNRF